MYLNADGILNDGIYEYDQIGFPFFHNIFNTIYSAELTRHKPYQAQLQLPDFSDTLLVKPTVPTWLRVDSTASMEQIESVLCSLADSMWLSAKSNDAMSAENIFKKNFEVALRRTEAINYSFSKLADKGISFIGEEDANQHKGIRFISWGVKVFSDPYPSQDAYLLFFDKEKSCYKKLSDFNENASLPLLVYTSTIKFDSKKGSLFLIVAEKYENSEDFWKGKSSEYVQAYSINGFVIEKAQVFNINGQHLSDLAIDRTNAKGRFDYDMKRDMIKFPLTTIIAGKKKTKTIKLRFDGQVFK